MVDSIKPSRPTKALFNPKSRGVNAPSGAYGISDDTQREPPAQKFVERRKRRDRRFQEESRDIYDMRRNRGRRRSDRAFPKIETDA